MASDLSNDVEIDGEAQSVRMPTDMLRLRPAFHKTMDTKDSKQQPSSLKDRFDSGLGSMSMSPQTSLESNPSIQPSLETVPEKMPVQCSDAAPFTDAKKQNMPVMQDEMSRVDVDKLETKLGQLSMSSLDDEGIGSISITDTEPGDIEVDLFNQDSDGDTLVHLTILSEIEWLALTLIELADDIECLNLQNKLFQSPLHLAVLTEQPEVVKALIAKGANVTLRDQQGNTALHIACRKDNIEMVRAIVESFGKDLNKRSKYFSVKNCEGLTCLHVASQLKLYHVMGYLFAKNADVNIRDAKSGRTVLHHAVERKDLETVILLLTHSDIDIDSKTFKGETPLVLAYWRNFQDIVKRLKSKGAYFSYDLFDDDSDDES